MRCNECGRPLLFHRVGYMPAVSLLLVSAFNAVSCRSRKVYLPESQLSGWTFFKALSRIIRGGSCPVPAVHAASKKSVAIVK